MLLANVPPNEACKPPAPNGRNDSASEKKKRAATLSRPPANSRSQLVVNWSSVYLPGLVTMNGAVTYAALFGFRSGVPTEGIRKPLGSLNWLLLNCSIASVTGSISAAVIGKVAVLKAAAMFAAERSVGSAGKAGLLICVPGERALRWRVP